jgi:putative oxidoreductase
MAFLLRIEANGMKDKFANFLNHKLIQFSARLILGGVFIYASIDKIAYSKEFAAIVMKYHILPERLAIYFAFFLPWLELFLGVFVILGFFVRESALSLSFLVLIFMIAIMIRSIAGPIGNCSCFSLHPSGTSQSLAFLIFRDIFFLLCGLVLALTNRAKKLHISFLSQLS